MGQNRRVENENLLVDLRAFNFKKAAPLIVKRIKVNRVHIPDWDDGELMFMLMDERASGLFSAEILFIFVLMINSKHKHFKF